MFLRQVTNIRIVVLLVLLSGCAVKPIGSVELGYAFPFSTDYWQHSDRSWQCAQPQVRFEAGVETENKWSMGIYHESMLMCGTFNHKPEIYENGAYIKKSWGGW